MSPIKEGNTLTSRYRRRRGGLGSAQTRGFTEEGRGEARAPTFILALFSSLSSYLETWGPLFLPPTTSPRSQTKTYNWRRASDALKITRLVPVHFGEGPSDTRAQHHISPPSSCLESQPRSRSRSRLTRLSVWFFSPEWRLVRDWVRTGDFPARRRRRHCCMVPPGQTAEKMDRGGGGLVP